MSITYCCYRNFRYCTDDCSIEELNFKKGDSIFIPTYGLHMDEKVWDEPEKFKPERCVYICHIEFIGCTIIIYVNFL